MQEVPLTSLDVRLQKQVETAQVALQRGNFDYVIEVTSQVLKHAPGCLPDDCCDAVSHLCGVPLCPVINLARTEGLHEAESGEPVWKVRGSPTSSTKVEVKETVTINGQSVTRTETREKPNCIPFPLPSQCCK